MAYTRSTWNTDLVSRLNIVVINRRYKTFVNKLHCALENGADSFVYESHKIRYYRAVGRKIKVVRPFSGGKATSPLHIDRQI